MMTIMSLAPGDFSYDLWYWTITTARAVSEAKLVTMVQATNAFIDCDYCL